MRFLLKADILVFMGLFLLNLIKQRYRRGVPLLFVCALSISLLLAGPTAFAREEGVCSSLFSRILEKKNLFFGPRFAQDADYLKFQKDVFSFKGRVLGWNGKVKYDAYVGDLDLVKKEVKVYSAKIAELRNHVASELPGIQNPVVKEQLAKSLEELNEVEVFLKKKNFTYEEFLRASSATARAVDQLSLPSLASYSRSKWTNFLDEIRSPTTSWTEFKNDRIPYVPTTRPLSIENMNDFSDSGIAFAGLSLKPLTEADGRQFSSISFLLHDLSHLTFQTKFFDELSVLKKIIRMNELPEQKDVRELLFFAFWHEGIGGKLIEKGQVAAEFRKDLYSTSFHITELKRRLSDTKDFGADANLKKAFEAHFDDTVRSLMQNFKEAGL